ncbi:hypothetical protein BaRGS_00017520 [Batillaria attramentaria]|uniref:Uncharacterized protein n=1 Tax=Batillaria attramentaria TaxID=370345 RepID=A0ABD0KVK2_9CAEN
MQKNNRRKRGRWKCHRAHHCYTFHEAEVPKQISLLLRHGTLHSILHANVKEGEIHAPFSKHTQLVLTDSATIRAADGTSRNVATRGRGGSPHLQSVTSGDIKGP